LAMAIEDCLETGQVKQSQPIPLLVGLAEPGRPGGGAEWSDSIIRAVEARLETQFDPARSATVPKGHTSGFEALRQARALLAEPGVPACLVCGVDSYVNAASLLWLERHGRLKTPANSDGLIPGEAAACALVLRPEAEPRPGCAARVIGLGFGREEASIMTEEP